MASFDFANRINVQVPVSTRLISATNVNSAAIDTQGFEGVAFVVQTGVNVNGVPALNIVDIRVGADTNITNSASINSQYIVRAPVAVTAPNTAAISGIGSLGGGENARYIFLTVNAGASNVNGSVTAVLGLPHTYPTT